MPILLTLMEQIDAPRITAYCKTQSMIKCFFKLKFPLPSLFTLYKEGKVTHLLNGNEKYFDFLVEKNIRLYRVSEGPTLVSGSVSEFGY